MKRLLVPVFAAIMLTNNMAFANGYEGYIRSLDVVVQTLVQERLRDEGFDPGPIDGKYGPKTRQALLAFRTANGINESEFQELLTPLLARALLGVEIEPGRNKEELSREEQLALIEQLGLIPTESYWGIRPD